jgi:hypothetical protein
MVASAITAAAIVPIQRNRIPILLLSIEPAARRGTAILPASSACSDPPVLSGSSSA